MIRMAVVAKPAFEARSELLVIPLCEDARPVKGFVGQLDWWLNGRISRLYKCRKFVGSAGQRALTPCVHWLPFIKLMLLGMGRGDELSSSKITEVYRAAVFALRDLRLASVTVMGSCPDVRKYDEVLYVFALVEGLLQGIAECEDGVTLSDITIPVSEPRKGEIADAVAPLPGRYKLEGRLRLKVS